MAHDVRIAELYGGNARDAFEKVHSAYQAAVRLVGQVNLGGISGHDELGIPAHSGEEHLQLPEVGVLSLVQNYAGAVQGTAPHIGQRRNLNGPVSYEFLQFLRGNHIPERIVQRLQIRVQLVLEVPGQKAQPFSGLHCGPCEYDSLHLPQFQGPHSQGNCHISLARARRTDGKGQVILEIGSHHPFLGGIAGLHRLALVVVDDNLRPVRKSLFLTYSLVEQSLHVIAAQAPLVHPLLDQLVQFRIEGCHIGLAPFQKKFITPGNHLEFRKPAAHNLQQLVGWSINLNRVNCFKDNLFLHTVYFFLAGAGVGAGATSTKSIFS